jgi:hypothetical protein
MGYLFQPPAEAASLARLARRNNECPESEVRLIAQRLP